MNKELDQTQKKAATKIQSFFSMLSPRKNFLMYIKQKGNYLAATMIQKHVRAYLCRKKLVPLLLEIKTELKDLDTTTDFASHHFDLKTNNLQILKPEYYGDNFDTIFARDNEDNSKEVSIANRILSEPKAFDIEKNPFDNLKSKQNSKAKRSILVFIINYKVITNQ